MSSIDPSGLQPPDDTGSDTFARFVYQAHIAFPLCVYAATADEIQNIYAEHIEDLGVDCGDHWRFLQVKTRDPGTGPWRLSDVLGDGGAVHSLWRAFQTVGQSMPATFEMLLEGHAKSGDLLDKLLNDAGRTDSVLITRIRNALKADEETVRTFAGRLRVRFPPVRASIASNNLRLLGDQAPHLTFAEARFLYGRVLSAIMAAMTADRLLDRWPRDVLSPEEAPSAATVAAKRISRSAARELLEAITVGARPLLRRIVDTTSQPSVLEEKLLAGGATQAIIDDAKSLRANASIRRLEYFASSISDDTSALDDLRERLRIATNGYVAEHSPGPKQLR